MITIFSDASFCPRSNAAGWGAWAKGDGWPAGQTFGGPIKSSVLNAGEAELAAIANAIHYLNARDNLPDGDIMIQSDCLRALQLALLFVPDAKPRRHRDGAPIPNNPLVPSPFEVKVVDTIAELVSGRTLLLRHVRGHKNGPGRSWVNSTCDAIAKTHMENRRRQLKGLL